MEQSPLTAMEPPKVATPGGACRAVPLAGVNGTPRDARAKAYTEPTWHPAYEPQLGAAVNPHSPERESATLPNFSLTPELGSG